jgi:hypothetical protein
MSGTAHSVCHCGRKCPMESAAIADCRRQTSLGQATLMRLKWAENINEDYCNPSRTPLALPRRACFCANPDSRAIQCCAVRFGVGNGVRRRRHLSYRSGASLHCANRIRGNCGIASCGFVLDYVAVCTFLAGCRRYGFFKHFQQRTLMGFRDIDSARSCRR